MSIITTATARLADIAVEQDRTDAVQSFVKQETVLVDLETADGVAGTGYTYTIGTGGTSVLALLRDHLLPALVGQDARNVEALWQRQFALTRATTTEPSPRSPSRPWTPPCGTCGASGRANRCGGWPADTADKCRSTTPRAAGSI